MNKQLSLFRKPAALFKTALSWFRGLFSGAALRLLLASAFFICLATVIVAGLELAREREAGIESVDKRFRAIEEHHLSAVIHSLEKFDRKQLSFDLGAILLFPDITYVEVVDKNERIISAGIMGKQESTTFSFPLNRYYEGRVRSLGDLNVIVSHAGIQRSIMEKSALILKTQAWVMALFAPFFLVLFHLLVGKNMRKIFNWSSELDPEHPAGELFLPGAAGNPEVTMALRSVNTLASKINRAVEERNHARSLHETLYETPLIGLIRIRISDQKILSASPRALAITAWNSIDAMNAEGFRIEDHILIPAQREEFFSLLARKEKVEDFRARFRFRDEQEKVLSLSLSIHLSEGYLEGSLVEITRMVAMEEERQLMKKELNRRAYCYTTDLTTTFADLGQTRDLLIEMDKAVSLGDLIAALGNEIRGPVRRAANHSVSVKDLTRIEKDLFNPDTAYAAHLLPYLEKMGKQSEEIIKELNRASRLVASFERLARDQADEILKEFNLKEYMEDVLVGVGKTIRSRKKKFTVSLNCPENLSIISYPGIFARIVTHLTTNALVHAFRRSSRSGTILVDFSVKGNTLHLAVSDNGKGITHIARHLVFQPFYTTKRRKGMKGTGLSFVRNEVETRLGGRITLTSIRGKGSTFLVEVPLIGGPIYREKTTNHTVISDTSTGRAV